MPLATVSLQKFTAPPSLLLYVGTTRLLTVLALLMLAKRCPQSGYRVVNVHILMLSSPSCHADENACMPFYRVRRSTDVTLARQASKTPGGPERKSDTVKSTLQGAFRSVWGASSDNRNTSSSNNSSSRRNGANEAASRPKGNSKSMRPARTATQRSRRGQNRPEQDSGKEENSKGRFYWNITGFPFPLGPLLKRRTIRYEVIIAD